MQTCDAIYISEKVCYVGYFVCVSVCPAARVFLWSHSCRINRLSACVRHKWCLPHSVERPVTCSLPNSSTGLRLSLHSECAQRPIGQGDKGRTTHSPQQSAGPPTSPVNDRSRRPSHVRRVVVESLTLVAAVLGQPAPLLRRHLRRLRFAAGSSAPSSPRHSRLRRRRRCMCGVVLPCEMLIIRSNGWGEIVTAKAGRDKEGGGDGRKLSEITVFLGWCQRRPLQSVPGRKTGGGGVAHVVTSTLQSSAVAEQCGEKAQN